jgi:hypothetical protein
MLDGLNDLLQSRQETGTSCIAGPVRWHAHTMMWLHYLLILIVWIHIYKEISSRPWLHRRSKARTQARAPRPANRQISTRFTCTYFGVQTNKSSNKGDDWRRPNRKHETNTSSTIAAATGLWCPSIWQISTRQHESRTTLWRPTNWKHKRKASSTIMAYISTTPQWCIHTVPRLTHGSIATQSIQSRDSSMSNRSKIAICHISNAVNHR